VIERLASREVYANRWMRVREDDVRFADGSTGIYGVVEKPDFALIVPWDGEAFRLVEQYRYPVGERLWEFPQGSWDDRSTERPAEDLARAELEEETGLRAGRLTHVGHLYEAYGFSSQGFHVFLAEELTEGERRPTASEQDMEVGRFAPDELWTLVADGRLKDAPSLAALALVQRATPSTART
jgi:8-oxo-dGTP pyrophosphatase MutT (NUDIX family)